MGPAPWADLCLGKSGDGEWVGTLQGTGILHPSSQPSSKAAMGHQVPGVSPPVEKGEAGVELSMGPPDRRLSVGAGHGRQVTAHASWSPMALPVLLFCVCL